MTNDTTICAISTPPGVGGIAVCRVSGPEAIAIVDNLWEGRKLAGAVSHTAHLGTILDTRRQPLDQAVATIYRAPKSFTGEDTVEISVHGSRYVQQELLNALISAGATLAAPGEFTRRAFASGRFDLAQAEAIADIIASNSRAAHRIALNQMRGSFSRRLATMRQDLVNLAALLELELDFSEEDVQFASRTRLISLTADLLDEVTHLRDSFASGSAIKDGIPVAIIGETNAGKSSLLNQLLGDDRAIVSDIHGTTRDTIEDTVTIGDYLFRFIDTAGIRQTDDTIERLGIDRSLQALSRARIALIVADATLPLNPDIITRAQSIPTLTPILLLNKSDLTTNSAPPQTDIPTLSSSDTPHTDIPIHSVSDTPQTDIPTLSSSGTPQTDIPTLSISAKTGHGLDTLRDALIEIASRDEAGADTILVTNARHAEALSRAADSLTRTLSGLRADIPADLVAQDLRETLAHLSEITGDIPSTEILNAIFSRFCIGK